MDPASPPYRVHQCSKCPGDTEYYCVSCPCDLCPQCKEKHVKDLKTIGHDVSHGCITNYTRKRKIYDIYLPKDNINIPTQEICLRHPQKVYRKYCEPCQVPVCDSCSEDHSHRLRSFLFGQGQHKILDLQNAYKTKVQQHRETIHSIRSEALFYRPVLLTGIKADVKTCHTEFSPLQSGMLTKAQKLKDLIDKVMYDLLNNVFCDFDFKHRCLKQKKEMSRHIVRLQRYEDRCVQTAFSFSALQFLSSIKTPLPQKHFTLHTSQLSMAESLNKEDVMESLSAIKITEKGNRHVGNQCLLKLMSGAKFHHSLSVIGSPRCFHISISRVKSNCVWISDINTLFFTNFSYPQIRVEDSCLGLFIGSHTVNNERELIYIDRNFNIKKLSKYFRKNTTFIETTESTWGPRCVYSSPSTGDLLVGMYNSDTVIGKVTRYNQSGQLTQTIEYNNTGRRLYREPRYITENNNGDVVVSDSAAVVVTERGGKHRFSYKGHPPGSQLEPLGICTDPMSHILVCDDWTHTVQMLDKDGQFLSHLLTKSDKMREPCSLSYDINTHRLWVVSGSREYSKVCVYRYITRQDALTNDHTHCLDGEPCQAKHQT